MSTQTQALRIGRHGSGPAKKRVLFLCIGNACRSQMAEGFARAYGSDVLIPASAGLAPAMAVVLDTIRAMDEKNIDLRHHFPKSWRHLAHVKFDLLVNISGEKAPGRIAAPVREWNIPDPVSMDYEQHCVIRDRIETLVMELILELRQEQRPQRA